ncbi:MAG: transporter [Lentisphaerae bacterium]|nr:transporter [Lentisphaerota bacterium]
MIGIRFDRNELAGAFGDIGTDFPLITGMILASGMNPAAVLTIFGALQIASGLLYRMPMPVQPLKAVAALAIAGNLAPETIMGGGLAIGIVMLVLVATGLINWCARVIPKPVIRGIQFGLGLKLALLAMGNYMLRDGWSGAVLAALSFGFIVYFLGHRRYPPAILVIGLGLLYALLFRNPAAAGALTPGFVLPTLRVPAAHDIWQGFLLLALAQIPLSLGNSVLATQQIAHDLYPERNITVRRIGLSFSLFNIVAPFFGGIPVCHGSGGIAGHHTFGGRTGGSVLLYGGFYLLIGLCFSRGFGQIINFFPMPVLGVILLFEGLLLMRFISDTVTDHVAFPLALLVGLAAAGLPYGFLIGLVGGTLLDILARRFNLGLFAVPTHIQTKREKQP